MQLITFLISLVVVALVLLLFPMWFLKMWNQDRVKKEEILTHIIQTLQKEKLDLLNRLMSQDIQTYNTMTAVSSTNYSTTSDPYIPQTDQDELNRLVEMSKVNGLGEAVHYQDPDTDTEMAEFLQDFGLGQFNIDREAGGK